MAITLDGPLYVLEGDVALYSIKQVFGDLAIGGTFTFSLSTSPAGVPGEETPPTGAQAGEDYLALTSSSFTSDISGLSFTVNVVAGVATVTVTNNTGAAIQSGTTLIRISLVTIADPFLSGDSVLVSIDPATATGTQVVNSGVITDISSVIRRTITASDWEALAGDTRLYAGIAGLSPNLTVDVQTGDNNNTVQLNDAIAFASLTTGGGNDIVSILVTPVSDRLSSDPQNNILDYVQFGHGAYKAFISTGAGDDVVNVQSAENVGYERTSPQDVPSYNLPDYYDSTVDTGLGNDYVYAFLPFNSQFLGGDGVDTIFFYGRFSDWSYQLVDVDGGGLDITRSNNAADQSVWTVGENISSTARQNVVRGFERVQFNDILLDVREALLITEPASVAEGSAAVYTISLAGDGLQSGDTVTFTLKLTGGTALEAIDFAALAEGALQQSSGVTVQVLKIDSAAGTLTAIATANRIFAAGETIATVSIPTVQDLISEASETFTLTLGGFFDEQTVTTAISDNDEAALAGRLVALNWKGGVGQVTLSTNDAILVPLQESLIDLAGVQALFPGVLLASDEYGIYFRVEKFDPEPTFLLDSDGFKIPVSYIPYSTTNAASPVGNVDDNITALGYIPGSLPGGTYSNALDLTTIRLGDGNDRFTLSGEGITQSLNVVVSKEASEGYIFQSNILAGDGDDYVQVLMPFQSVFKGGANTVYSDAVFSPDAPGIGVILDDDLTLEEVQFGDTIELKGSRFDWDIEFKDSNNDGLVTLDSILDGTDYIATSNNNQIYGFERIRFGDILFDLVLHRQQQSSSVYGQPDYYLIGSEAQAPELNSDIASGSQIWEAFRFNRTKLQGITGTATNITDVFTGNANDTPFLVGALQFASLNTEGGNDIAEIGSIDQASVDLGTGKQGSGADLSTASNQLKVNGSVTFSSIDGAVGKDNIIVNSISNSAVNGGAGDDVIQVVTEARQTQFDGGVGTSDVLLLPGTFFSFGLASSTTGGITTFNDVFGNIIVGFESIKFSDLNLAPLQQLTLAQTPVAAPINEGTTATYAIALSGSGLQLGQSVVFSLQFVDGTAQFLSDLAAISANSLLSSEGIVFSNISVDAAAGLIRAVATTSRDFSAGATIATLALPIKEDLLAESSETFGITLRDYTQSQTVTTIINDLAPVSISLTGPPLVTEGQSATYTVALNGVSLAVGRSVTFTVDSGSGTATDGIDFSALQDSTTLVPATGISLSAKSTDPSTNAVTVTATNIGSTPLAGDAALLTFQLPITVDSVVEGSETFGITLTSSTAAVGTGLVTTTINDLVPTPSVALSGVTSVTEGQSAAYAVSLVGGGFLADQSITLTLGTAGGTAVAGVDFAGLIADDIKAAAGITLGTINTDPITKALTVTATNSSGAALSIGSQVLGFALLAIPDTVPEENKTYGVSLSSPTASVISASVNTTILDDDLPVGVESVITASPDAGNVSVVGTSGVDLLTGNNQANQIYGSKGPDVMTGLLGQDLFRFRLSDGLGQGDQITDFNPSEDQIQIADISRDSKLAKLFKGQSELPAKKASKALAIVDSAGLAETSKRQLVYDRTSGALYYNENGKKAGFGSGGQIATLPILLDLQASDITLLYNDQPF